MLIAQYEAKHFRISSPSPVEAIRFRMEQLGINQEQTAKILDVSSGRLSEFMSGKRSMPIQFLVKVKSRLGVPADSLLPDEDVALEQVAVGKHARV